MVANEINTVLNESIPPFIRKHPLIPERNYRPISPYSVASESHIKVRRIREMITN